MIKIKHSIFVFILGIILITGIIGVTYASDDDFDGIDDDYEESNKRVIDIEFSSDKFEVESVFKGEDQKDDIGISVRYDEDGITIKIGYDPHYEGEDVDLFELEFEISVRRIIEFVDVNDNSIYDNNFDIKVQEVELNDFNLINHTIIETGSDTNIHYLRLSTTDGIFSTNFYFSEEFDLLNKILLTPTETKIDFEINNFNYFNNSSMIALDILLEAEGEYEEKDETEDEKLGFAINEASLFIANDSRLGFFSWNKNASIDGILKDIFVSPIEFDDVEEEQRIYFNYPRGNYIHHDPKIGIEGILRQITSSPFSFDLLIIVIILTGITIAVAYSVYHYRTRLISALISNKQKTKTHEKDSKVKIQQFYIQENDPLNNINLTAITEDFMDIVDQFEWNIDEKEQFIKEMLSMSPSERQSILKDMQKSSKD